MSLSKIAISDVWRQIRLHYRLRKEQYEPDLRRWEFFVQMLISAYFSWRWLGRSARFRPFSPGYWLWLASYSNLSELVTRAQLADQSSRDGREKKIIRVSPYQKFIEVAWPNPTSTPNSRRRFFSKRS